MTREDRERLAHPKPVPCPTCNGKGFFSASYYGGVYRHCDCHVCGGTGKVEFSSLKVAATTDPEREGMKAHDFRRR